LVFGFASFGFTVVGFFGLTDCGASFAIIAAACITNEANKRGNMAGLIK
jgi:hypothetical protein